MGIEVRSISFLILFIFSGIKLLFKVIKIKKRRLIDLVVGTLGHYKDNVCIIFL